MRPRSVHEAAFAFAPVALGVAAPLAFARDDASARRNELRDLMALTDALAAGNPAGGGLVVAFEPHFLKGEEGQTYVPFSLTISEHSRQPAGFVVYVRVVEPGRAPPQGEGKPGGVELATADIPPGELPVGGSASRHPRTGRYGEASARLRLVDKDREAARGPHVFEDSHVVEVDEGDELHPYRLQRALAVPPGEYVVYVAVGETGDPRGASRSAVMRVPLAARDFTEGTFSLSSLILAERVEPLPVRSQARGQSRRRPYAVGSTEIVPAATRELTQDDEPAVAFQIYGADFGPGRPPNVTLEYLVLKLAGDAYVPHARLPAQTLDAKTLPAAFDRDAGHQLGAVQDIPVAHLPPGEYLLEVTATDRLAGTSARAALDFAVR
jgi:hypothetical protein